MPVTGHTLDHTHNYERGASRTESPIGSPFGHSHSIPTRGEWTGETDGHRHSLPTRASDASALERSLKETGGLKGALGKLVAEPEPKKNR